MRVRYSSLVILGFVAAMVSPLSVSAGPARPTRPTRPSRPPRPTRVPRQSPTATTIPNPTPTATPVVVSEADCPTPPERIFETRLGHLFWKYPGTSNDVTGKVAFRIPRDGGFDPEQVPGSVALVKSSGEAIIAMNDLRFTRTSEGSWAASTEKGYVVLQTAPGAYTMSFNFQNVAALDLPPDFFTTGGKLCFRVGDSGTFERFVCQIKPGDGFLCHE